MHTPLLLSIVVDFAPDEGMQGGFSAQTGPEILYLTWADEGPG